MKFKDTDQAHSEGQFLVTAKRRETLTSSLIRTVSARIHSGLYKRGEQLPTEKSLIDEFGVSRTVVREAIANLKASGLVSTQQGVGAFVVQEEAIPSFRISSENLSLIEEVIQALELRIAIESEAAALTAQRRTDEDLAAMELACDEMDAANRSGLSSIDSDLEFHRSISRATQNDSFVRIFNYLGEVLIPRTRVKTHKFDALTERAYIDRINNEHRNILQAIRDRDPDKARAAMRMHLSGSRDRLSRSRS